MAPVSMAKMDSLVTAMMAGEDLTVILVCKCLEEIFCEAIKGNESELAK